jgi:hypothetical protein
MRFLGRKRKKVRFGRFRSVFHGAAETERGGERSANFQTSIGWGQAWDSANIEHPTSNSQHRISDE